jgi:hypothetical protein
MRLCVPAPRGLPGIATTALVVTATIALWKLTLLASAQTATASEVAVKAALIYNFAKFAEWPGLPSGSPIVVCVVGSDGVAEALVETVRGRQISGHALEVRQPHESATWPVCQVLFIADAESRRVDRELAAIEKLAILTVSDGRGFSQARGIIELYVENERMRFAINVDAAARSGLHLSSRLLTLARVVRDGHGK